MAKIDTSVQEQVYRIGSWSGVHESPDGDAELKPGEAAEMRNFRITRDGNLQLRPGLKQRCSLGGEIRGLWRGQVHGTERLVCAAGKKLWLLGEPWTEPVNIGVLTADSEVFFFGFSENLYIMDGSEYLVWDGTNSAIRVDGYRPIVTVSALPAGGGTSLEQVNKLCGYRRAWFSPDGTSTVFHLPETGIETLDWIKIRATGEIVAGTEYTADCAAGTVTFTSAPPSGTDTYEIAWTFPVNYREQVTSMRFAEIFNGTTDNRVFIYGDGSNTAFYSGLDYDGHATAEYFPDLNVLDVGAANTPITALIRHYSKMVAYKSDCAYTVHYGTITLKDGSVTAAFYTTPINRIIGCEAPGQACLVLNSPLTLFGGAVYQWKNGADYSSNLTVDERQAKNISENVFNTMSAFDMAASRAFDDNYRQEYYAICGSTAVVYGYAADAWYIYTDFPVTHMVFSDSEVLCAAAGGKICLLTRDAPSDDGALIDAYWRSGSIALDRIWQRKYSGKLYLTMKPEGGASLTVTARTDRKSDFREETISFSLSTFSRADFGAWSFNTNRLPHTARLKLKAKKFAYYQLILKSRKRASTATVLSAAVRMRSVDDVKQQ